MQLNITNLQLSLRTRAHAPLPPTIMSCTPEITDASEPTQVCGEPATHPEEQPINVLGTSSEMADPSDLITDPSDLNTDPFDLTTDLSDLIINLSDGITDPSDDTAEPSEETTYPSDEGAYASDEGTHPSDEGTHPSDEGTHPSDEGTYVSDEGTHPSDEGTYVSDEGTYVSDEASSSGDELPTHPMHKGIWHDPAEFVWAIGDAGRKMLIAGFVSLKYFPSEIATVFNRGPYHVKLSAQFVVTFTCNAHDVVNAYIYMAKKKNVEWQQKFSEDKRDEWEADFEMRMELQHWVDELRKNMVPGYYSDPTNESCIDTTNEFFSDTVHDSFPENNLENFPPLPGQ